MAVPSNHGRRRSRMVVGAYFGAAILYLLLGATGLVWVAPELAHGLYLAPRVAAVTHLFTLGFLTLVIFGALAELLPMALAAKRYSASASMVAWGFLLPGIPLFAYGLATSDTSLLIGGAVGVGIGVLVDAANVFVSLTSVSTRSVTWGAVAAGCVFLVTALGFGLALADNLHTGAIAGERVRVLAAHLHIALVGWVLIVIVGVAHRVLPVFLSAPPVPARATGVSVILLGVGVSLLACGLPHDIGPLAVAGILLIVGGVAVFLRYNLALVLRRGRRRMPVGMQFVGVALLALGGVAILGPIVYEVGAARPRVATTYVAIALLGVFVPFVIGVMYEIVPVIAWSIRYAGRLNRGVLPQVSDLYSHRVARWQQSLHFGGVALMGLGVSTGGQGLVRGGALGVVAAVALFVSQLVRMFLAVPAVHPTPGSAGAAIAPEPASRVSKEGPLQ